MDFRKLRFIGIWNDDCCSISLKFEILSTFLGKNVLEITGFPLSGKSLNILECPGNEKNVLESYKMSWKVLEINGFSGNLGLLKFGMMTVIPFL